MTRALGDKIASVAQPIAKTIDYAFGTNIQGCRGCHQMQSNLNAGMPLSHAFYDRFWNKTENTKKKLETMEYNVNKTQTEVIAITADDPKQAMEKAKTGEGTVISTHENFSVNPRPGQQPPQPRPA